MNIEDIIDKLNQYPELEEDLDTYISFEKPEELTEAILEKCVEAVSAGKRDRVLEDIIYKVLLSYFYKENWKLTWIALLSDSYSFWDEDEKVLTVVFKHYLSDENGREYHLECDYIVDIDEYLFNGIYNDVIGSVGFPFNVKEQLRELLINEVKKHM